MHSDDNWLERDVVSACKLTASRYAEPTRTAAVAARDQSARPRRRRAKRDTVLRKAAAASAHPQQGRDAESGKNSNPTDHCERVFAVS